MQERTEQLDLEKLAQIGAVCTLRHLRMATRVVTQLYDEILKPTGLRGTQLHVLIATALLGPVTIIHLAEVLVMDRTTLTRNLKPLEGQGLIRAAPGDDQRTREVTLTPHGKEALAQAIPFWEQAQARVVDELGEEWRRGLLGNLSDLVSLGH